MKVAKLVIGIVSFVFSIIIFVQSCATGLSNAFSNNTKDTTGSMGVFVGLLIIVAGIVAIAAKKSKGGAVAAAIIYGLAGIIGVASSGTYKDLVFWGVISLIFAAVFVVSIFVQKYDKPAKAEAAATKAEDK